MSILSACAWCKWANKLKGPQCKNWPCGATIISSTSTLGYFGARNPFLTIILKNNHDINIKSKMAARASHNRKGNCGILSKCCSYKGIMMIIIFYIFWDKEHHFWKKKIKAINIYMLYTSMMTDLNFYILWENVPATLNCAWHALTITTADFVLQVFAVAMQMHALSELVPEALLVGLQLLESESHHWCPNQTLQNVGGVGFAGQQPIMMAWYAHKIRSSMMAWLARYDERGCWWKGNDVHVFTTLKSV